MLSCFHSKSHMCKHHDDREAYWWMPDDKFMAEGAILMFFPDHDPGQWRVGNKISQAASEPLWAYYKPGIDSQAPKVFSLMSNMLIYDDDMNQLLEEAVRMGSEGVTDYQEAVACAWLQRSTARWQEWIPKTN